MYNPHIFKLPTFDIISEFNKQDKNSLFILSPMMTYPLFSLGFHHFIQRTKDAMNITNKLETKNEFYFVVNPFEISISNYEDNINNLSKIYLNISDEKDILNNKFYKIWEMNFIFDIIGDKHITFASLAENPESLVQAIIHFREKILNKDTSKDNIFSVNIYPEKESTKNDLNQYAGAKTKTTNNISDIKTISVFKKEIEKTKKYANLVIADGENIWENKNNQEQESYKLLLGEILCALKVLEINGSFVLKIFDTFTIPTIKLVWLLTNFFEESYIYKPYFSRPNESEKYIICKNFKFNQNDKVLITSQNNLEIILKALNTNYYLNNIIPNLDVPIELLNIFKFINIKFVNTQQIVINDIVKYIKDNNYFGDKYHEYRNNQIEATKWWINTFYPSSDILYKSNKENISKIIEETITKNNLEINKFTTQLI